MENKKFEKLNEQKLEKVTGGVAQELPRDRCPNCKTKGMRQMWDNIDGVRREVSQCHDCHCAFYINDDGELVSLGQWC